MSAALALLSSLLWGTSDFLGGSAARRLPVALVLGGSQAAALVVLLAVALATGGWAAPLGYLIPGVLAGAIGALALGAFYQALSLGTMGVVAPLAALGVAVPLAVGLLRGESPSTVQLAGIAVAVVGVVLASGPELQGGAGGRPLLLAAGAAVGFGLVLLLVAAGSAPGPAAVVMTLLTMRVTSLTLLAVAMLALARRPIRPCARDVVLLAAIGWADAAANGAYALATRGALLSVTAVLASLYPVVTALLAFARLGERLRPVQVVGAGSALAGVVLLSLG